MHYQPVLMRKGSETQVAATSVEYYQLLWEGWTPDGSPPPADPFSVIATMGDLVPFAKRRDTPYSVFEFGAMGDGVTDDTEAFQDCVDYVSANGGRVIVPGQTGTVFLIYGTVDVKRRVEFEIAAGAIVRRPVESASTAPMFRIAGNEAKLVGNGRIETDKASPSGVILIGPPDLGTLANVLSARVEDLVIRGVKAAGNVSVKLWSSFVSTGGGTYQNTISNLTIDSFGTGILASDVANANDFVNLQMRNILEVGYDFWGNTAFRGADENSVSGGFVHASPGVTCVKMRNAYGNMVSNLRAEPGGATSKPYDLDATSQGNSIVMLSNMASAGTDLGVDNSVVVNGKLRFKNGTAGSPGIAFESDPDVGLFRQAADVLAISTGGVERVRMGANMSMQTNLDLNTNYLGLLERGTTPSAPTTGGARLFMRSSDGAVCLVRPGGAVEPLGSGGPGITDYVSDPEHGTQLGQPALVGGDVVVSLSTVWGMRSDGSVYYDPEGAQPGEEAILGVNPSTGDFVLTKVGS